MAETVVLFVLKQVYQLLQEEGTFLTSAHKEFADIKDELEGIHALLRDVDTRAADGDANEGIKVFASKMSLINTSFIWHKGSFIPDL